MDFLTVDMKCKRVLSRLLKLVFGENKLDTLTTTTTTTSSQQQQQQQQPIDSPWRAPPPPVQRSAFSPPRTGVMAGPMYHELDDGFDEVFDYIGKRMFITIVAVLSNCCCIEKELDIQQKHSLAKLYAFHFKQNTPNHRCCSIDRVWFLFHKMLTTTYLK
jgi:hypothetical protein